MKSIRVLREDQCDVSGTLSAFPSVSPSKGVLDRDRDDPDLPTEQGSRNNCRSQSKLGRSSLEYGFCHEDLVGLVRL
jgi:hypothetical protein